MMPWTNLGGDLRHAVRALARDRGFTATALLTLVLCLGANVALFAVVNAVLLRPLPFPQPDRLVTIGNAYPKAGVTENIGVSAPHYLERRARIAAFAEAAAYRSGGETIGEPGSPDRVDGLRVTPSFFQVLQVKAALGRTFTEEEGTPGKTAVVVLSDGLWRQKFGADPAVIGQSLRLGGASTSTIIGVLPPGFRFLGHSAQLWTPLAFDDEQRRPENRHSNNLNMIARLQPGVSRAEAQAQIDALNLSTLETDPFGKVVRDAGFHTVVEGQHARLVADIRPALLLLQTGVLLLLLIGVVNLANLTLVRATGRTKEFSVRQALGAGAGRIARQLVVESLVLTLGGFLPGLAVGWAGLRVLDRLGTDLLPQAAPLQLDATVVLVTFAGTILIGLLLALPAIWHARHGNLAITLSVESRGGTTSRATHRVRYGLIVTQFALAFVLLSGASLLALSFSRVLSTKPGFQPDNVLTGVIPLPRANYKENKDRVAFLDRLTRELHSLPGLIAVGFGTEVPFVGRADRNAVTVLGYTPKPGESVQAHIMTGVTGDFFPALGIPLRAGRFLTTEDSLRSTRVCVIDEHMARRYWGDRDPIGGQLVNGTPDSKEKPFTVVGVVGAVKQEDLADPGTGGAVYEPFSEFSSSQITVALRSHLPPESVASTLRNAVLKIDPNVPLTKVKPLVRVIDDSLAGRRSPMFLAALFAGVALLLASVGLYGVLAYAVAQRRREIGVRMALGALPEQIWTQFLALGVRLVALGTALGLAGAWFSGQAMSGLLFGVGPFHPGILAGTALALVAIALPACFIPATRAARVPPLEALRSD
ncbi:MAG: ABC transporter permease [Verrucomicrobia bacterium]|nr:ABC transporter permease [Verrucomicrobiota bacterium]